MFRTLLVMTLVVFVGLACDVYAQDATQKTQQLVAALDKTKYKKKEKANISIEIYVDVKNEAVVRDPSEYAGTYECDGYRLTLQVTKDGIATGEGYDSVGPESRQSNYTLRDGRIQGALLTATKVYDNGKAEPFEAVFTNRTVSTGKNANQIDSRETLFGLGFIQSHGSVTTDGNTKNVQEWTNRVFLERK